MGGQGRCERRSEVHVKIKNKYFFFFFGGGGGSGWGGRGVRMDVNEELEFLRKLKKTKRYLIPEYHICKISMSKFFKKGNN